MTTAELHGNQSLSVFSANVEPFSLSELQKLYSP